LLEQPARGLGLAVLGLEDAGLDQEVGVARIAGDGGTETGPRPAVAALGGMPARERQVVAADGCGHGRAGVPVRRTRAGSGPRQGPCRARAPWRARGGVATVITGRSGLATGTGP